MRHSPHLCNQELQTTEHRVVAGDISALLKLTEYLLISKFCLLWIYRCFLGHLCNFYYFIEDFGTYRYEKLNYRKIIAKSDLLLTTSKGLPNKSLCITLVWWKGSEKCVTSFRYSSGIQKSWRGWRYVSKKRQQATTCSFFLLTYFPRRIVAAANDTWHRMHSGPIHSGWGLQVKVSKIER